MKRFSRKSKKGEQNVKSQNLNESPEATLASTGQDKPKTKLMRGLRKRLSIGKNSVEQQQEQLSPTVQPELYLNQRSRNLYETPTSSAGRDHDYSEVPDNILDANERTLISYSNIETFSHNVVVDALLQSLPPNGSNTVNNNNGNEPHLCPESQNVKQVLQSSALVNNSLVTHPLMLEFQKLARKGWYWGPMSREQAERKLNDLPEASFLVRDSSDDRYLLSLSFRSNNRTLHTRIEHSGSKFSFYEDSPSQSYTSVVDLIENSIRDSNEQGVFCYSRSRHPNAQTFPVRLMHPVSRFTEVRPLQDLCRFVIRQYTRIDHIQRLPLPNQIKGYLTQSYF